VVYQSPFRLFRFITELPSVSVTFSVPVTGVTAGDLTVNESPATNVTGSGKGPYVFTGFEPPDFGSIKVSLAPGVITGEQGLAFEGQSWTQTLVDSEGDADNDGANNGEEANRFRTDPTNPDTDGDGLPDGFETAHACLDPLQDEANPRDMLGNLLPGDDDADNDGVTNLEEFVQGTDPCSSRCDVNGDALIDRNDINAIFAARNTPTSAGETRDADNDGRITVNDARICTLQCTKPRCSL
jgi:hypothetical protein